MTDERERQLAQLLQQQVDLAMKEYLHRIFCRCNRDPQCSDLQAVRAEMAETRARVQELDSQ